MIQTRKTKDVSRDVKAIYDIAERLLNLDGNSDKRSVSWVLAKNFVKTTDGISLQTLLKVWMFDCLTINRGASELMNV